MKRNTLILILSGFFLLVVFTFTTTLLTPEVTADAQAVSAANQLYRAGNYEDAQRIYEQLIAQGVEDSTIYYNLGNTYYRQGDLGRAILNFQRAAQLNPRDPDIRANLELARETADVPFTSTAPGPIDALARMTSRWLTLNETAILALGIWFLAGFLVLSISLLERGNARRILRYGAILALFILVLIGLSLGSRIYTESTQNNGVVVAPVVAVSSEPGEGFATDFNLTSGTEVSLVETQGSWARLAVPGDVIEGWIPLNAVETVAGGLLTSDSLL
jgi:hypothetical protein